MRIMVMMISVVGVMLSVSACGKKGAVLPPPGWEAPAESTADQSK